jgi:plasmid stability protein
MRSVTMAQLLVRDLDPAVVARLKTKARLNHRSLQGEVRAILEQAAEQATPDEALALIEKWQRRWGDRLFSDSADLLREERDRR